MHGPGVFTELLHWFRHPQLASPASFAMGIYLVERRGKKEAVNSRRQVQISTLLESIPEAALIVDGSQRIIDANSAATQILGCSREELLASRSDELSRMLAPVDEKNGHNGHQDTPSILVRALKGEIVRHERRLVRSTRRGEKRQLLISATPMRNERGDVVAALLMARDITELTALQNRVGDLERHLAVGQMAAALAHDFNNILASIGQAAYVMETGGAPTEEERRSLLGVIQNAVHRGSEIISRIRDYLRTGSGALGPVDVRQVMQEAVDLTRPLWNRGKVRVISDLHPVPMVRSNAADLRRVFTNLIINAIEAMPAGGQTVVSCREQGGQVVATVSDTGVGITPEDQGKIFYPYFTTKQEGTGLGLSGAQKIILSQGGHISFRTDVGKGTQFIVNLPVRPAKAAHGLGRRQQKQPAA